MQAATSQQPTPREPGASAMVVTLEPTATEQEAREPRGSVGPAKPPRPQPRAGAPWTWSNGRGWREQLNFLSATKRAFQNGCLVCQETSQRPRFCSASPPWAGRSTLGHSSLTSAAFILSSFATQKPRGLGDLRSPDSSAILPPFKTCTRGKGGTESRGEVLDTQQETQPA